MDLDTIWDSFLDKIKENVSSLSYETWFKDTKLVEVTDKQAFVIVPMPFHKNHLVENYNSIIENTFASLTGNRVSFSFLEDKEWEEIKENDDNFIIIEEDNNKKNTDVNNSVINYDDTNLNKDYTFENFIVGSSNRFAYTTSLAVAEKPGKAYNPLFLYGKSGLGKTHLMHSIGNYIIENSNLRVLYISSDKFVNDFINAVRYNDKNNFDKIDIFKHKYRNIDVLMIDDIQFLGNATKGQEEFFHTFNELYNENKQIIIASDRSVDDLKMLENRLLTRFNWGLTANITPPDFELRVDIIRKKIAHQESAKDVPDEVIEYIANNFASDVRQLEGAITRVFAYALMMNKGNVDLDTAVEALKDQLADRSVYKNDVHRIQTVVCDYFKITIDDIKGKKRSQNINYPRQVAIYLCRTMANESFPKIGTHFGGRDHSTIMSSYRKIVKDLETNEQLKVVIKELKERLST
ncbi:MAG: chromosomal replication initiator protein DnaA [Bacilli bacterium]|nr:chromosomal replication initiator protein DnaA [Bacilli bacterium]